MQKKNQESEAEQEPQESTLRSWGMAHGAKAKGLVVTLGKQLLWRGRLWRPGLSLLCDRSGWEAAVRTARTWVRGVKRSLEQ